MIELGVNIDHVATVRQARQTVEPDPVWAAVAAELGGADGITVHLREDRRHIQDRDVRLLRETVRVKLNLEMACNDDVLAVACQVIPDQATLVPEKRQEITTEGGLDVLAQPDHVRRTLDALHDKGVFVSLFLDPVPAQIEMAKRIGADAVELHTGTYSLASPANVTRELKKIIDAGKLITSLGMRLHAGHGLTLHNVEKIAQIDAMAELNIGHSIIARALFIGLKEAVAEMKRKIVLP
ncbi:MAG: pyridoxine 5'-phosphate synthase [Planctomycetia bacterium]|nr:pyridoxine 5'-phosphate synthase [Planctomycetia bacterium]